MHDGYTAGWPGSQERLPDEIVREMGNPGCLGGYTGKGYRLRLLYRQKYTMKLTLWYRLCQVTYRNNSLRGGFGEATYMHCLGGVSMLLLFQVSWTKSAHLKYSSS